MAWGRMDDKFHRNPKVRGLRRSRGGREALGVWVFWWSWCLDDPGLTGFVPVEELSDSDERSAKLLCDAGLWESADGGYRFHDFSKYNPSRLKLDAKKTADKARVAADREMERVATELNVARDIAQVSLATNENVARDTPNPSPATNLDVASPRARWVGSSSDSESSASGDLSEAHRALMRGYKIRYERIKQTPWASYAANYTQIQNISFWVEQTAAAHKLKVTQVTAATLDEFFSDNYAEGTDFSLALLAKNPAKYYTRHRGIQSHLASKSHREAS